MDELSDPDLDENDLEDLLLSNGTTILDSTGSCLTIRCTQACSAS
jgi:hypothetical protein